CDELARLRLCLGTGAEAAGAFPGRDADGPGRAGPFQSVRGDVMAAPLELLGVLDRGVDERLHLLLGHRVQHLLVVMDREHELHRILLPSVSGIAGMSLSTRYTNRILSCGQASALERRGAPIRLGAQLSGEGVQGPDA